MQPKELTPKQRLIEATSNTLTALRYPLLGLLIALLVFVIVYVSVTEVRSRRLDRSTTIVEGIEDDFYDWVDLDEGDERTAMAADLVERLDAVIDDYPRLYSAQRGLYLKGQLSFETGDFRAAGDAFVELADRFPGSYLAPVSLVNAATSLEEAGAFSDAIPILERVIEEFDSPEAPAVLFSIGRLYETVGNPDAATAAYEKLLDEHPSSGWTNIAQSRIIGIKIDRS